MVISPAALWLNTVFAAFDANITLFIHKLFELGGGFFTPFFEFVSFLGKGGIVLILLSLFLVLRKNTRRIGTAMFLGLAIGFIITNCCLKIFIARPRPYIDQNGIYYPLWLAVGQFTESDKSFPSGHVCAAMGSMTGVFFTCKKPWKWLVFLFPLLMAVSRIYLVVHFPSDVLGGLLVGFIGGCLGTLVTAKLPRSWYDLDIIKEKGK